MTMWRSMESAANRHGRFLAAENNNNNNNRRQHVLFVIFYVLLGLFLAHLIFMSLVWVYYYKPPPFGSSITSTTNEYDTAKHHHRHFDETTSRFRSLTNNDDTNQKVKSRSSLTKDDDDWRYPSSIFNHVHQRAVSSKTTCQSSSSPSKKQQQQQQTNNPRNITTTNEPTTSEHPFPHLPPYGIINAISSWQKTQNTTTTNPSCLLPPSTECNERRWTVVFLSHSSSPHISDLKSYITEVFEWSETARIVLVWNSPREELTDEEIWGWFESPAHKLDIFFVLDHVDDSSLFNRYHPSLSHLVTTRALLYFDDDGPVFRLNALKMGFELWKRNSGVPAGCFVRGVSYGDARLEEMTRRERDVAERTVLEGWQSVSPYDLRRGRGGRHPQFIPTCPAQEPNLIYDYNHVTPYGAQISLPSGTFLHVNFLCFLWHPLFEDIRQYVRHHPAHADDIAVSVITSQVTGKPLRTYPMRLKSRREEIEEVIETKRRVWEREEEERKTAVRGEVERRNDELRNREEELVKREKRVKRREDDVTKKWKALMKREKQHVDVSPKTTSVTSATTSTISKIPPPTNTTTTTPLQQHRRLLWKTPDWATLRTEALNAIVGYFGSIGPGSVGYCLGSSDYDPIKKSCGVHNGYKFHFAYEEDIPWVYKGMLGYDQCEDGD